MFFFGVAFGVASYWKYDLRRVFYRIGPPDNRRFQGPKKSAGGLSRKRSRVRVSSLPPQISRVSVSYGLKNSLLLLINLTAPAPGGPGHKSLIKISQFQNHK